MDQKKVEERKLKTIISGMKSKGYSTTVIKLNLIVSFAIILIIFTIPNYLTLLNITIDPNLKLLDMIIYVGISVFGFFALQYALNRMNKEEFSLVKDLREFKAISKKFFIQKHLINMVYCFVLLGIGIMIKNYMVTSVACYLLAFDYPHLFIKVLLTKTSNKAFLVFYPTSLKGALVFDSVK